MLEYEAYKDSGAAWLGKIPYEWKTGVIGSLYTLRNTKVSDTDYPPLSVTMKGVVPQLENAAKTDAHDARKLVLKGDFAINSRSDRRGSCGISDYDGSVSLINIVLTPREKMNPQYYNWLFHTVQFADEYYKNGHGIVDDLWTTRWNEMKRISIPVPSLTEQAGIADYLKRKISHIDSVIAEAKASIEEYKEWKASIIHEAVTKGLDLDVEMKDSGVAWIGDIPDTWSLRKIKKIASTGSGGTPKSDIREYYDGGINWVCSLDLHEQSVSETKNTLSELGLKNCASEIRPIGTVVMAMYGGSGTIGNSGILRTPCATNQAICCIMFGDKIIPDYGFYYIRAIRPYWMIYAVGTRKDPNISQAVVSEMPMVVPSLEEQKCIVRHLDKTIGAIDCLIEEKETLIVDLESYKKSLIFEVVTGKRRVC